MQIKPGSSLSKLESAPDWCDPSGCQYLLKVCASQLPLVSCHILACVAFIMLLVDWRFYHCPRTLTLASACHVDSTGVQLVVGLLWIQVCMRWNFLLGTWTPSSVLTSSFHSSAQQWRIWIMWVALMLPLSSLAMLNMTSMCVPHFLQLESYWLELVKLGAGVFQGSINAMAIPWLAKRLTPSKHSYTSIASTLTGACLPVWCIIYLDRACFGRWTAWWAPCAHQKRQQFNLRFDHGPIIYHLMNADDLCSFNLGESCSICAMSIALKMQEMLMSKVMVSSIAMPLRHIAADTSIKDPLMAIVQLGLSVQMFMLWSLGRRYCTMKAQKNTLARSLFPVLALMQNVSKQTIHRAERVRSFSLCICNCNDQKSA